MDETLQIVPPSEATPLGWVLRNRPDGSVDAFFVTDPAELPAAVEKLA